MTFTPYIPTALYRFFDAEDRLLYVGITGNLSMRFFAHSKRDWWADAIRNTIEWHDTRELALAAETLALITEYPIHNVTGVPDENIGGVHRKWPTTIEEVMALPTTPTHPPRSKGPRRARGTGGLFYVEAKDLWIGRVDLGWSNDGRRVTKEVSSRSQKVARQRLKELKESVRDAY